MQSYTLLLTEGQSVLLSDWCENHGWKFCNIKYALYAYKGEGVNIVVYKNYKLLVQGKNTDDFVIGTLEVEITKTQCIGLERLNHPEWFEAHAGLDESGKGDLFGPLVTACVIADGENVDYWLKNGLKESKNVGNDKNLFKMEHLVRSQKDIVVEVAYVSMEKYNQLYDKFKNLNKLLAWLHSKSLQNALAKRYVKTGLLDQFTNACLVQNQINIANFTLNQRIRAEDDPVVAAASIIARATYVRLLNKLSEKCGISLPKGAGSNVKDVLKELIFKCGRENLNEFAKIHFKTINEVV